MRIPIYQVDAFTSQVFAGNPAAICPLDQWLPDTTMASIAAENNLSETAYFVKAQNGYELRWFTPSVEVDLCGHATLASAWVLFHELGFSDPAISFHTKSGELIVERKGDMLEMDFPAWPPQTVAAHPQLLGALGGNPTAVLASRDYVVEYGSEAEVRALKPDLDALAKVDRFAVIATAKGDTVDFVSRFFAPAQGVPEDPVTGRAHSTLTPYWAARLGKDVLHARQVSKRGGELYCQLRGERVRISGRAALFLRGEIVLNGHAAFRSSDEPKG
jgi:PhzF family phenazine biosynthesis protein